MKLIYKKQNVSFYEKDVCKHLTAWSLLEKLNLRGLNSHRKFNKRYRCWPNDSEISEPIESQVETSMTQIPSSVPTKSSQVHTEIRSQPAYTRKKSL